jgi:nucleotide-binding universal stress UspA family protein
MTTAISHILVPLDFSAHSVVSLEYATGLATRLHASVELLHVVEDPATTGTWAAEGAVLDIGEIRDALVEDAERRLDEHRRSFEHLELPVVTTVRTGTPWRTIVDYAQAAGIDLLVMGTHGHSGLAHLFLGSVAERVVRHATCPVVTVPDSGVRGEVRGLGFALGHFGTSRE